MKIKLNDEITWNLDEPRFDLMNFYRMASYDVAIMPSDLFDCLWDGRLSIPGSDIPGIVRDIEEERDMDSRNSQKIKNDDRIMKVSNPTDNSEMTKAIASNPQPNPTTSYERIAINAMSSSDKADIISKIYSKLSEKSSVVSIESIKGARTGKPLFTLVWDNGNVKPEQSILMSAKVVYFGQNLKSGKVNTDKLAALDAIMKTAKVPYERDGSKLEDVTTINVRAPKTNPTGNPLAEKTEHSDDYKQKVGQHLRVWEYVVMTKYCQGDAGKYVDDIQKYNDMALHDGIIKDDGLGDTNINPDFELAIIGPAFDNRGKITSIKINGDVIDNFKSVKANSVKGINANMVPQENFKIYNNFASADNAEKFRGLEISDISNIFKVNNDKNDSILIQGNEYPLLCTQMGNAYVPLDLTRNHYVTGLIQKTFFKNNYISNAYISRFMEYCKIRFEEIFGDSKSMPTVLLKTNDGIITLK